MPLKKNSAIPRKTTVKQLNESLKLLRKVIKYLERQNTFVSRRLANDAKIILDKNFDCISKSEGEITKPIPGYEGLYLCYEDGVIISCGRMVKNNWKPHPIFRKGRFLRPRLNDSGYFDVKLTDAKGVSKIHLVSRLVALTYHGPSDLYVNHIDGNKLNNHYTNLEYATQRENVQHYLRMGLKKTFGRPNAIPVKLIDIETGEEMQYPSVKNCAEINNSDPSSIHYHLEKGDRLFRNKYKVKYA